MNLKPVPAVFGLRRRRKQDPAERALDGHEPALSRWTAGNPAQFQPRRIESKERRGLRQHHPHPVVPKIGNQQIPGRVDGNTGRRIETRQRRRPAVSRKSHFVNPGYGVDDARGINPAHGMRKLRNKQVAARVGRQTGRQRQTSLCRRPAVSSRPLFARSREWDQAAPRRKQQDAMGVVLGDVKRIFAIDGHIEWRL